MRPDIAGVFVHFLLCMGQDNRNTLIRKQTIAAGTLIDILEIHIPLWSVTVQFQNAADECIRIATGWVCQVVLVFITVFAIGVLFQQFCNLLLLCGRGRQMAGGIFRHFHTFTGSDVLEVAAGRFLTSRLEIGEF